MGEWIVQSHEFNEETKREMMARLIQIETIVLMSSSCYSFGGRIYKQLRGAGIGERGSACIAKVMMSVWDKLWAKQQDMNGLWIQLFF